MGRGGQRGGRRTNTGEEDGFSQRVLDLARVTRVTAGGKRMRFRACVIVGDRKGKVGAGLAKGSDVQQSIAKATRQAKQHLVSIQMHRGTIPHRVAAKEGAASVLLKPAPEGTGIIAGGVVRAVLELSGIENVVSKILGSKNKINNVRATFKALQELRPRPERAQKPQTENAAGHAAHSVIE